MLFITNHIVDVVSDLSWTAVLAGITSEIKSRKSNMFDIYDMSSATLRLDREQINNRNDNTE